jgi:hypothetical protein
MLTSAGKKTIGEIKENETIWCYDQKTGKAMSYTVFDKLEYAGGKQKIFNIEADKGETFLMNGVMVLQK